MRETAFDAFRSKIEKRSRHEFLLDQELESIERSQRDEERRRDYEETQNRASERAISQLETISQKFPEGSKAREIMEDSVGKQLSNIIDTATHFMQTIDEDFKNLLANVDQITRNSIENSNQYIAPASRKLFLSDGK